MRERRNNRHARALPITLNLASNLINHLGRRGDSGQFVTSTTARLAALLLAQPIDKSIIERAYRTAPPLLFSLRVHHLSRRHPLGRSLNLARSIPIPARHSFACSNNRHQEEK